MIILFLLLQLIIPFETDTCNVTLRGDTVIYFRTYSDGSEGILYQSIKNANHIKIYLSEGCYYQTEPLFLSGNGTIQGEKNKTKIILKNCTFIDCTPKDTLLDRTKKFVDKTIKEIDEYLAKVDTMIAK